MAGRIKNRLRLPRCSFSIKSAGNWMISFHNDCAPITNTPCHIRQPILNLSSFIFRGLIKVICRQTDKKHQKSSISLLSLIPWKASDEQITFRNTHYDPDGNLKPISFFPMLPCTVPSLLPSLPLAIDGRERFTARGGHTVVLISLSRLGGISNSFARKHHRVPQLRLTKQREEKAVGQLASFSACLRPFSVLVVFGSLGKYFSSSQMTWSPHPACDLFLSSNETWNVKWTDSKQLWKTDFPLMATFFDLEKVQLACDGRTLNRLPFSSAL